MPADATFDRPGDSRSAWSTGSKVLKDGASSLYGADAIGGRGQFDHEKHFTGYRGQVEGGRQRAWRRRQLPWPISPPAWALCQRRLLYVSGEYSSRHPLYPKDRGFPYNTYDLSSIGGLDRIISTTRLTVATTNAVVVAHYPD